MVEMEPLFPGGSSIAVGIHFGTTDGALQAGRFGWWAII
jgi:hypothetical protein